MFIKWQKNIKALELEEFKDRLDAALSKVILVKGVSAGGEAVRIGWSLGSFSAQPIV